MTRVLAAIVILAIALAPSERARSEASHEHVLRFADGQDVSHLNTLLITTYPEAYPAELTGAYLTRVSPHGKPIAELAREIPTQRNGGISADGKTIVYHLRNGLRWSDGSPLRATDVVFTTKAIIAKNSPVASIDGWDRIANVDSPRADDVRFTLREPYAPAIVTYFSTGQGYSILPERLLRGVDLRTAPFNALPTGAGPFRYASFERGDQIVMEANPFYFRGRPKLDKIVYKFVPNENTVATLLLTGEIDLALAQSPVQQRRLAGNAAIAFIQTPTARAGFIGFMTAKPPLDDRRVRLALRYLTDRNQILQKVYFGKGYVSDDPDPQIDPFYGSGIATAAPDPVRAGRLLDDAGWRMGADGLRRRDGQPLTIDLVDFTGNEIALSIVEIVRSQWAKAGVTLASRTMNGSTFYAPDGMASRGEFGANFYGQSLVSEALGTSYTCKAAPPNGFNYGRYCNPRVDALLAKAGRTYDDAAATRLYLEARRLIAADAPDIVMIHRLLTHAIRAGVTGFHPNGFTTFDDAMNLDVR